MELATLTQNVCHTAKTTGAFIREQIGRVHNEQIEEKSLNSLVSYVDQEAERRIVADLRAILPTAAFLTEEATVAQSSAEYRWIIDPLDGTTNFLFELPCFAVSIALERNGKLILGVVYEIGRDECFYAWQDGGAWCNDKRIYCRKNGELAQSLLATGFPYYDYSRMEPYLALFRDLMQHTRGIRRWGSAATDLAYTACGRYDGFFEYSLNAWDIAAGIVLVREAGGICTDFAGGGGSLLNGEIVAASRTLHSELLAKVDLHLT